MEKFDLKLNHNTWYDLITLGRAAIDFNPIELNTPLNLCTTFKMYIGGSTVNTAIGVKRLNNNVSFLGKVASNQFGKFIFDFLKKEEIDISHLFYDSDLSSSVGLTFTEMLQENSTILMYRNNASDLHISPSDFEKDYLQKTKLLLISGTALAAEPSRTACLKALLYAKNANVKVIFDLDYRPYNWKDEQTVKTYYSLIAHQSDLLIGSKTEMSYANLLAKQDFKDILSMGQWWIENSHNYLVVIKDGKNGSYAFLKNKSIYKIHSYDVKNIKGFGGGDAYAAFLINGILKNESISKTFFHATIAASLGVLNHASSNLPTALQIAAFIKAKNISEKTLVQKIK